jgi:hypothetical protein
MWLAYIVPGLIGMCLCMVQLLLNVPCKKDRKKSPVFTSVYCSLAIIFCLVDTIPVAALFTDLPCAGGNTILDKGDGALCAVNRVSICLLLSIYYWMAAHCVDIHIKVVPGFERFRRTVGSQCLSGLVVGVCCGLPLVSAMVLSVCDAGNDPDLDALYWTHLSRDLFTCSPRVPSLWLEIVCIHAHFLVASLVIVWCLFHVGRYIALVVVKKRNGPGGSSQRSSLGAVSRRNEEPSHLLVEILRACPRVFLLAACMLVLLGIHFLLAILLVPRFEEFGSASEEWLACKKLEDACTEIEASVGLVSECEGHRFCGELRAKSDGIPSVALLELYFFSRAGLVFIIGFTFVFSWSNIAAVLRNMQVLDA